MNYLKTYEGLWKNLNPFDKDKSLAKKFHDAISEINISGVKLEMDEETKRFITYKSKVSLTIPISGYKDGLLWITKASSQSNNLANNIDSIKITLQLTFDNNSPVFRIYENRGLLSLPQNTRGDDIIESYKKTLAFLTGIAVNKDLCNINLVSNIKIKEDDKQLPQDITTEIKSILNQDWEKLRSSINELCDRLDEINKEREESNKRKSNLISKVDEISDLLIDLEDMSKSHDKEINDGIIKFTYNIPGIKIEKTEFSRYSSSRETVRFTSDTAKLVLTKELVDVMNAIESFKNKVQDEIEGAEVKVYLKDNSVTVIFELKDNSSRWVSRWVDSL